MAGESIRFNASLNTAGFDSGAARLQQVAAATSGKVSASFSAMGAKIGAVIAPFVGLYAAINSVKNALDLGGRLNDLSKTTGETAGNLAILERAFQNAGVGGEKMGMAIASMSNFITDFQNGSKTASETMERLGISMADLSGKTPIERMQVFMDAIAGIQDPALRTALAMDVFKKAGKEIVPLASDFSGELANARGELGSLPRILTENATSLDDLGDKLTNSVGNKLTELAVGLAAGATGADNFVAALSKIDAAGLGERIGDALRAAFAAPLEVLQGAGDILISGVLKAGNALVAGFKYAVEVFYNLFTDSGYWSGIWDRISGGLAKLGEGIALVIVDGIQSALSVLKDIPFLGDFVAKAEEGLQRVKDAIIEAGQTASMSLDEGGQKITDAWNKATESAKFVYNDILGAEKYSRSASDHWQNARAAAEEIKNNSAETAANFGTGSAAITKALESIRGFSFDGGDPAQKPDWFKSSKPAKTSFGGGGGGGGRGGGGGWGQYSGMSSDMRVGDMRAQSAYDRATSRVGEYLGRGAYRSAAMAQMRGEDSANRAMENAMIQEQLRQEGYGNIGEKFYRDYNDGKSMGREDRLKKDMGDTYDPKKSQYDNYRQMLRDQTKTPEELKREEEEARNRSRPPGGGGDSGKGKEQNQTEGKLDRIVQLMEERLPIRVLSKAA